MFILIGISYDGSDVMTSPRGSLGSQVFCPSDKPIFSKYINPLCVCVCMCVCACVCTCVCMCVYL